MTLFNIQHFVLPTIIYNILLFNGASGAATDTNTLTSSHCGELSFTPNLVSMFMYIMVVCGAAYCHGRHRGEYIHETTVLHKVFMWFISFILLYIITVSWLYYNFFHSETDINYISRNFPWLTLYGIAYTLYASISTFTFAYHSHYNNAALIQFVCLLCTVLPLGLAILTFFLFRTSQDIKEYEFGFFNRHTNVLICLNIDVLSLVLSCLLFIALCHHIYVLCRVLHSFIRDTHDYLSHPHTHRGQSSNLTRSSTETRGKKPKRYVYKSQDEEESESYAGEEEIMVDVAMTTYHHHQQHNTLNVPNHGGDDESIELNQSYDVKRALPGSMSIDL
eukprot:128337_1